MKGPYTVWIQFPDCPFKVENRLFVLTREGTLEPKQAEPIKEVEGAKFFPIDLRRHCNVGLAEAPGGEQAKNDLRGLAVGVQTLRGVEFEIVDQGQNGGKSQIRLLSTAHRSDLPREVLGIEAGGRKAKRLYFLHTAEWGEEHSNPLKMGEYRVHYQGREQPEVIAIVNGRTIADWWSPKELPEASIGWSGHNGWSEVGVYVYIWTNVHPELPIQSIDVVSDDVGPIIGLIAISGQE